MMGAKRHSLQGRVVVVTGASSGIGRAAALRFAEAGARLVLAARRRPALEAVATQCQARGATASAYVADVTKTSDLDRLVDDTITEYGRIDVWVNNAGTTFFAGLEDGDFSEHRRVLETNLIAPMYATRLLIPIFRKQRSGTLINVGSVLSQVGQPFVPSYVISKFGLQGLTEATRAECADMPSINICTIMPYATDTPHFEEGANALGRRAHAMPPVQDPMRVADAIVHLAERPRRVRYVPRSAALGVALHALFPRTTERMLQNALDRFHLVGQESTTEGNLFRPSRGRGSIRGTRAPVAGLAAVAAWVLFDLFTRRRTHRTRPLQPWPQPSTR